MGVQSCIWVEYVDSRGPFWSSQQAGASGPLQTMTLPRGLSFDLQPQGMVRERHCCDLPAISSISSDKLKQTQALAHELRHCSLPGLPIQGHRGG